jgi:glycosyltransferase involved in cell wall biosynthesis
MKISVVMPSYLHEYQSGPHKSATNREFKFKRAVDSFLMQSHGDAELIIVSDGCDITNRIVEEEYSSMLYSGAIILEKLDKQEQFSGKVRARGVENSSGELVCYLDTDDIFGQNHLSTIDSYYDRSADWCYYDDYLYDGIKKTTRDVKPEHCKIGTSSFCHMRSAPVHWKDGYGHDWATISEILQFKHTKINTPEYLVCHLSAINLDF